MAPVTIENPAPAEPASETETLLDDIAKIIEQQLQAVREDRFGDLLEFGAKLGPMMQEIADSPIPRSPRNRDRLRKIQANHRHLGLMLDQRGQEIQQELARAQRGRTAHKAYKRAL